MSIEQANINSVFSSSPQTNELNSGVSQVENNKNNQSFISALQQNLDEYDTQSDKNTGLAAPQESLARQPNKERKQQDHSGNVTPPTEFQLSELQMFSEQVVSSLPLNIDSDYLNAPQEYTDSNNLQRLIASQDVTSLNVNKLPVDNILATKFGIAQESNRLSLALNNTAQELSGVQASIEKKSLAFATTIDYQLERQRGVSYTGLTTENVLSSETRVDKALEKESLALNATTISMQQRRLLSMTDMPVVSSSDTNASLRQNSGLVLNPAASFDFYSHQNYSANNLNNGLNSLGNSIKSTTKFPANSIKSDLAPTLSINSFTTEPGFGLSIAPQSSTDSVMPKSFFQISSLPSEVRWGDDLNSKLQILIQNNQQRAQFHINPRNMGPLDVQIVVGQDQQVSIGFNAQNAHLKEAIDAAMPRLREMLQEQGLNLSNVDVGQRGAGSRQDESTEGSSNRDILDDSDDESSVGTTSAELTVSLEGHSISSMEGSKYSLQSLDLFA